MIEGFVAEEVVAGETGVAFATVGVEDAEGRPPPRRAISIASDQRLRPLADDVAPEPDPRASGELESDAGRLGDGGGQAAGRLAGATPAARRFEHDEERLGSAGEGRQ
ncbi:MAG TPA: hypothetical protein VIM25_10600, partial [Candidatus Limnocylindrales bacterium]